MLGNPGAALKTAAAAASRMQHASVFVTCPDEETAKRIARALLERRLVACANVFPVGSMYHWEGRIEEGREVAMLLKTRRANVDAVAAAVREIHPYTVPCVVGFPLEGGNADYFDWVDAETRAPPR